MDVASPEGRHQVLLISGSLRAVSANTAVLQTAGAVAGEEIICSLYDRMALLPAFNPDLDRHPLEAEVGRLRDAIHEADGILFSTPEYAGALPGSLKNLLDWTIGDEQPRSIYNKAVGWINASPRGATGAYHELRTVLGYAHANIVEPACIHLPIDSTMIGTDGLVEGTASRRAVTAALKELVASAVASAGSAERGSPPPAN